MESTAEGEFSATDWLNGVLESLRRSGQFQRVPAAATRYYVHIPLGLPGVHYAIARKGASVKVGIYFETRDAALNEALYQRLLEHKHEIESYVSRKLIWKSEAGLIRRFAEIEEPATLGARALRDRTAQTILHLDNVCRPILKEIISGAS
jgi:hypothetical protein